MAMKTRRRMTRRKRSKTPAAARRRASSPADLQEQLDQRTRDLNEALEHQAATSEVLSIIRRSPADAQPVFDAIVKSAARLCGALMGIVYLYDGNRLHMVASHNIAPEARSRIYDGQPERWYLGGRAIVDRTIVHVPDVLADPDYSRKLALAGGFRAGLSIPLLANGKPVGAISVGKVEPVPFSDRQVQLLNTFADQAVIAIENVRLFEAERQRTRDLSEALEQQTATSEVLKVISSSPGDLQAVFETMLEKATELCEASYGTLWLREGDAFRTAALHGALPQAWIERWRSGTLYRPGPDVTLSQAVASRKPVQTADLRENSSYLRGEPLPVSAVEVAGIRTLVVPMLKENEPIGGIAIYRKEVRPFTDKQIAVVTNFAAQAVIAIENARLLSELRESLQQQTATADVLKVISRSTFDLQAVLDTLVESVTQLCDAEGAHIFRFGGEVYHWPLHTDFPANTTNIWRSIGLDPAGTL
jgi:GAF domain-containing protein